jgi:hypothetical protein
MFINGYVQLGYMFNVQLLSLKRFTAVFIVEQRALFGH